MPSFVPANVFKALVKMALTIMPEEQLRIFADTIQWLNAPLTDTKFTTTELWLAYGAIGSQDRFPFICVSLLKRKKLSDFEQVPLVFRLNYGNFQFDVPVPMFFQERMIPIRGIPYLPNLFDLRDG